MLMTQEGVPAPGQWDGGPRDEGMGISPIVAIVFILLIIGIIAYNVKHRED